MMASNPEKRSLRNLNNRINQVLFILRIRDNLQWSGTRRYTCEVVDIREQHGCVLVELRDNRFAVLQRLSYGSEWCRCRLDNTNARAYGGSMFLRSRSACCWASSNFWVRSSPHRTVPAPAWLVSQITSASLKREVRILRYAMCSLLVCTVRARRR